MSGAGDAPTVVAVVGSPRARGNTSLLVDAALAELERRGARVHKVLLAERVVGPCLGHEECARFKVCPQHDDAEAVLDLVYEADGLLLAGPVYYENVTAQLKAFMDRNVFRYAHDQWLPARAVGLLAVTAETGLDDALDAMRRYVSLSTVSEVPTFACGVFADGLGADGRGVVAQRPDALAAARSLATDMASALELH